MMCENEFENLSGVISVDSSSSRGAALVNESSVSKEVVGG